MHPDHPCTNPRILLCVTCRPASLSVSLLKPLSQEESRLVWLLQRRQWLAGRQDGIPARHQTCSQVGGVGSAQEAAIVHLQREGERRETERDVDGEREKEREIHDSISLSIKLLSCFQ